nr:hypothetical protein [Streptomyces sp. TLI_235]
MRDVRLERVEPDFRTEADCNVAAEDIEGDLVLTTQVTAGLTSGVALNRSAPAAGCSQQAGQLGVMDALAQGVALFDGLGRHLIRTGWRTVQRPGSVMGQTPGPGDRSIDQCLGCMDGDRGWRWAVLFKPGLNASTQGILIASPAVQRSPRCLRRPGWH